MRQQVLLPAALWLQLGSAIPQRAMHDTGAEQAVQSTLYCTELIESTVRPGALHTACRENAPWLLLQPRLTFFA